MNYYLFSPFLRRGIVFSFVKISNDCTYAENIVAIHIRKCLTISCPKSSKLLYEIRTTALWSDTKVWFSCTKDELFCSNNKYKDTKGVANK